MPARCLDHLASALEHSYGEREIKDIFDELLQGSKQIWLHSEGDQFTTTVITHLITYPNKLTCEICYLGGEKGMHRYLSDIATIEEWAKLMGCTDVQIIGRKGWSKMLEKEGYSDRYVVLGKNLD